MRVDAECCRHLRMPHKAADFQPQYPPQQRAILSSGSRKSMDGPSPWTVGRMLAPIPHRAGQPVGTRRLSRLQAGLSQPTRHHRSLRAPTPCYLSLKPPHRAADEARSGPSGSCGPAGNERDCIGTGRSELLCKPAFCLGQGRGSSPLSSTKTQLRTTISSLDLCVNTRVYNRAIRSCPCRVSNGV